MSSYRSLAEFWHDVVSFLKCVTVDLYLTTSIEYTYGGGPLVEMKP